MTATSSLATLMIAASENDADMLYVSELFVPDAFIAIELSDGWHGLFSPLEVDRAGKQSKFNHVHLDTPWREKAKEHQWEAGLASAAAAFLKAHGVSNIRVPGHFPLRYAEQLRNWDFHVEAAHDALFASRLIKSEQEIQHLAKAERLTKNAMRQAEKFLAECDIGHDGILLHAAISGKIKSRHLRSVIETYLIQNGAMPAHTIVACGKESADPHQIGQGYLRAHQPIIIDIFPRVLTSGYWGDMTRTYVKGKASKEISKLYRTVKEGQDIGLNMVTDGVAGADIHHAITEHFNRQGFKSGIVRGKQTGFFHGTGHGVGLEIHEAPRVSTSNDVLKSGQVITIEPGLYYPRLGGVRIEDMVVVRKAGHTNLTQHIRKLEIK
ncbi:MAG: Xaa-Pro peptidase family protein [Mariprofundaceae bacterium]